MKSGNKIAKWMIDYGADFVLERVTSSERACDIDALRIATQAAAEQHWLPLVETRKGRREAQMQIQKKATAGRFQKDVRRRLKLRDIAVTHLVNETFYDVEEHWDDQEWMFKNRHRFFPNRHSPAIAIVVANFDEHATSASLERLGKTGRGLNHHIVLASLDAQRLDVLSDEAIKEVARSCAQAERIRRKLQKNPAFAESYNRELKVVNGN